MSIAEFALGESSVAAQPTETTKKTPPKRQTVATGDAVLRPEAR